MNPFEIFDISPVLSPETAVFPGDQPFERHVVLDLHRGHHLTLSHLKTAVHIGAHTDAPNHYHPEGVGIDQRDLSYYLGPCQVMTVQGKKLIEPSDITVPIQAPRVIFKTNSFPNPNQWQESFTALHPSLIPFLAKKKVRLVGIDTPSIDPSDSKTLDTHKLIYENDMAILEGIVLNKVSDGIYTLVALPLPLKDLDASPVRAVLLKEKK